MKILAVGGGSGGHVTPIAAVLEELLVQSPDAEIQVWADKKFAVHTREALGEVNTHITTKTVVAGKLRRFYDIPLWKQLLRIRTIVIPNIVDICKLVIGTVQSLIRLVVWRPDVVFCKGGFVSLPVGYAASMLGIPIILHDSDTHPGLANRMLAPRANKILTGATVDNYSYPLEVTKHVGIPIRSKFHAYSELERKSAKSKFNFSQQRALVVITGGGLGAKAINDSVIAILDRLLAEANVLLISGDYQYEELKSATSEYPADQFQLRSYLNEEMIDALVAADIVIARAGATTLFELAALEQTVILIPNPNLAGGHQTKNAKEYAVADAAVVLNEYELANEPVQLLQAITTLIMSEKKSKKLSENIKKLAMLDSARTVADELMKYSKEAK